MTGFNRTVFYFNHKLYPSLVDPITLQSTAVAWEIGSKVEIIPASVITEDFVIVPEKSKIRIGNYKYSQYRDYFEPIIPESFSEEEKIIWYLCSLSGNIKRFCEFKSEKVTNHRQSRWHGILNRSKR